MNLGRLAAVRGDRERGRKLLDEGLAISQRLVDRAGVAHCTTLLAALAEQAGDYESALQLYRESLAIRRELDAKQEIAEVLESIASLTLRWGRARCGARLVGAAAALREAIGVAISPADRDELDHDLDAARQALGHEQIDRTMEEGRAMTLEQAIDDALGR
jgi:tetratricopeptide (TPR) repeat protein